MNQNGSRPVTGFGMAPTSQELVSTTLTTSSGSDRHAGNRAGRRQGVDATAIALRKLADQLATLSGPGTDTSNEVKAPFADRRFLQEIAKLVEVNTDLPVEAGPHLACVIIGHGLTRLGIHVELAPHHIVRPNVSLTLILPTGVDLRFLIGSLLSPILQPCPRAKLPLPPNAKSLLKFLTSEAALDESITASGIQPSARTRIACGILLTTEPDLLAGSSRSGGATLNSLMLRALDGNPIEGEIGKNKYVRSPPVHLSLCFLPNGQSYFARVHLSALLEGVPSRLMIARVQPPESPPRLSYGIEGVDALAQSFAAAWEHIKSGPRTYRLSAEASRTLDSWWADRCLQRGAVEMLIRRCFLCATAYALIFTSLEDPAGTINATAMRAGLDVVDRHLRDVAGIIKHVGVSAFHVYIISVENYLRDTPNACRRDLLKRSNRYSAKDLNTALEVLAELHEGSTFGERAKELLAQTRTARH